MSLEDFLSAENKASALEALRNRTFGELYTACIRVGIDPDTFEYETWVLPEHTEENNHIYQGLLTVSRMCDSLKIIDSKLP